MLKYQSVVFDLDGTLADTKEGIERSLCHALAQLGIDAPSPEKISAMIGPPLLNAFMNEFTLNVEQGREAVRLYRERYGSIGLFECSLYPGIKELLQDLAVEGAYVAVATAKPTVYASQVVEHLGIAPYIKKLQGVSLTETNDSKAELIRTVLKDAPGSAVMIGDRYYDIDGAKDVGIESIGILHGFGSREELSSHGADAIAQDTLALRALLIK